MLAELGMADGYAMLEGPSTGCMSRGAPRASSPSSGPAMPWGSRRRSSCGPGVPWCPWIGCRATSSARSGDSSRATISATCPWTSAASRGSSRACSPRPWRSLREVRPYAWVAREIGRPRAVRAVGSALAENPIPFVIPCHRVVRADGHIGEYGAGGPEAKRAVLATEGIDPDELEELADRGIRYVGSDTTGIFCYPSCRHARRVTARHRVTFRSGDHARAAGFRSCKACRPLEGAVFAA
ncbi:MAG: methylated-DNA--[protein]-cysteine S-methyltransferase [Chloroflexota bacterium]